MSNYPTFKPQVSRDFLVTLDEGSKGISVCLFEYKFQTIDEETKIFNIPIVDIAQ